MLYGETWPSHDTIPSAVIANKNINVSSFKKVKTFKRQKVGHIMQFREKKLPISGPEYTGNVP